MPKINIFDQTLKIIARHYGGLLLRLAFPNIAIELIGPGENVEVALAARAVEFVHRVFV